MENPILLANLVEDENRDEENSEDSFDDAYVDDYEYEDDDVDVDEYEGDESEVSLIVLADESVEPSISLTDIDDILDEDEYSVSKDGDMPQDFLKQEEVDELVNIIVRNRDMRQRHKRGIIRKFSSDNLSHFRSRIRNRQDKSTERIRSRSPVKKHPMPNPTRSI